MGTIKVGSTSSTVLVPFTFDSAGTLSGWGVYTQGATGLDYTEVAANTTCLATTSYKAGDTCSVAVSFAPKSPGLRIGAVQLMDSNGNPIATAPLKGVGSGPQIVFPGNTSGTILQTGPGPQGSAGIALDGSGDAFVTYNGDLIEYIAVNGQVTSQSQSINIGHFGDDTFDVVVDGAGDVFVASNSASLSEIQAANGRVSETSTVLRLGSGFLFPSGLAVDASGNLYVADIGTHAVTEFVAVNGQVSSNSTVIRLPGTWEHPRGIAVDVSGNVFIADEWTYAVSEIHALNGHVSPSSTVSLVHQWPNTSGSLTGVAVDAAENVFVSAGFTPNGEVGVGLEEIPLVNGSYASTPIEIYHDSRFVVGGGALRVSLDGRGNIFAVTASSNIPASWLIELPWATAGTLTFQNGSTTQTAAIANGGNAVLTFPIPPEGSNPTVNGDFAWDHSSTCAQTTPDSTNAFTLKPGASCTIAIDQTSTSATDGSVVLTDNSSSVTQTIPLSGTGEAALPHLAFTTRPSSSLQAGNAPGTVKVSVEDSNNNVITTSSATITLTVTGPNSYSKVYTATASSGVATFSSLASLGTAGSYSYTATDTADGFTLALVSESVWVPHLAFTAAPPASLILDQAPGSVTVSVEDSNNNVLTTSSATLRLTVTGPNSYARAYTATASSGVATFRGLPSFSTAGSYAYTARDNADGLTQAAVTETVWAPQLAFTTPPPGSLQAGHAPGTVAASVEDPNNNVISTSSATVRLTVTGPNSYSKAYTATASSGVATFSGLPSFSIVGSYTYTALDNADGFTQAGATETVWAPPPFGGMGEVVDSVTFSATVGKSDSVLVKGWVADPIDGAPLGNVKAYIDGTSVGSPTLGIPRPDIAAAYNNSAYLNSGYRLIYPAASLSLGAHKLTVTAIDSYGESVTLGPRTFTVYATAGAPYGGIDEAGDSVTASTTISQSGTLKVSGWVIDSTDGAPLGNVKVYVDGNLIGTPTGGLARSDIAAIYGSAYLHCGYRLLYAASGLALGTHQVTVVAIDSGARSTTFGPRVITVQ
jgi:hypothetical protein